MLRIRLRRVGKKKHPSYRIVVADARAPRDGAYVEWIGNYDPMVDPPAITLKADRALAWLKNGAQPSDPVRRILERDGVFDRLNAGDEVESVDAESVDEAGDEASQDEAAPVEADDPVEAAGS
jgi:small subunit ribosomal protein S16